jgi:hypothetical protein
MAARRVPERPGIEASLALPQVERPSLACDGKCQIASLELLRLSGGDPESEVLPVCQASGSSAHHE